MAFLYLNTKKNITAFTLESMRIVASPSSRELAFLSLHKTPQLDGPRAGDVSFLPSSWAGSGLMVFLSGTPLPALKALLSSLTLTWKEQAKLPW